MEEIPLQNENILPPVVVEEEKQENPKLSNGQTKEELIKRLPIPGPGRSPDTKEQIVIKKATKQLIKEYKESFVNALPQISPVLIKKAVRGDMAAIKEINELVVDKPNQKGTGGDIINNLILVKFIDGNKTNDNTDTGGIQETV